MRSWTRTLNKPDAHTLLTLGHPGTPRFVWTQASHDALSSLSVPRRRELIRMVASDFLTFDAADRITDGLFNRHYQRASAVAQLELVHTQWALSHPLPLATVADLIEPRLAAGDPHIPLEMLDTFVRERLETDSSASQVKTRAVLIGALEAVGALGSMGTGRHRTLWAQRGQPIPEVIAYLTEQGGRELVYRLTAALPG